MQFRTDANVFSADGEKVGEIDRVVLDPDDREITHLVVRQGFLFTTDKILPVDMIEEATEERVELGMEAQELEELPDFEETNFVPVHRAEFTGPRQRGFAPPFYWYPPTGITWGSAAEGTVGTAAPTVPPFVTAEEERVPEGTVPLKEGATVVSSDGDNVGSIKAVITDPEENRATHLVIARGLLLTEEKCIPTSWISTVMEDEVHLKVASETLQNLPEYESAA